MQNYIIFFIQQIFFKILFFSDECPKCEGVKDIIESIKFKYPVRVKAFDVEKDSDYKLFKAIESIHSGRKFSVPLIILGETILIGEKEISKKLEKIVRDLYNAGGSQLPYLGSNHNETKHWDNEHCNCGNRKGPPTISEEWKKIRNFLGNLL